MNRRWAALLSREYRWDTFLSGDLLTQIQQIRAALEPEIRVRQPQLKLEYRINTSDGEVAAVQDVVASAARLGGEIHFVSLDGKWSGAKAAGTLRNFTFTLHKGDERANWATVRAAGTDDDATVGAFASLRNVIESKRAQIEAGIAEPAHSATTDEPVHSVATTSNVFRKAWRYVSENPLVSTVVGGLILWLILLAVAAVLHA